MVIFQKLCVVAIFIFLSNIPLILVVGILASQIAFAFIFIRTKPFREKTLNILTASCVVLQAGNSVLPLLIHLNVNIPAEAMIAVIFLNTFIPIVLAVYCMYISIKKGNEAQIVKDLLMNIDEKKMDMKLADERLTSMLSTKVPEKEIQSKWSLYSLSRRDISLISEPLLQETPVEMFGIDNTAHPDIILTKEERKEIEMSRAGTPTKLTEIPGSPMKLNGAATPLKQTETPGTPLKQSRESTPTKQAKEEAKAQKEEEKKKKKKILEEKMKKIQEEAEKKQKEAEEAKMKKKEEERIRKKKSEFIRNLDFALNKRLLRLLVNFFLMTGLCAIISLCVSLCGLVRATLDSNVIQPTRAEIDTNERRMRHLEFTSYFDSWEVFTNNCCCMSRNDTAMEVWKCYANGQYVFKKRLRVDPVYGNGFSIRGYCSTSFTSSICQGPTFKLGSNSTSYGRYTVTPCKNSTFISSGPLRYLW
jgi:hypothetical protein